jgi:hypothetical protein
VQEYGKTYQVVDNELTEEDPQRPSKPSLGTRMRAGRHRDGPDEDEPS